MDDVAGEITIPSNLEDKAPDLLKSIFDDPHPTKVLPPGVNKDGLKINMKEFYCHWCKVTLKGGWNATKAIAHLAKRSGNDIRVCSGRIPADFASLYRTMYSELEMRQKHGGELKANTKASADHHDASAMQRAMERKSGRSIIGTKPTVTSFFSPSTSRVGVSSGFQ
jgi:hypothetical protein